MAETRVEIMHISNFKCIRNTCKYHNECIFTTGKRPVKLSYLFPKSNHVNLFCSSYEDAIMSSLTETIEKWEKEEKDKNGRDSKSTIPSSTGLRICKGGNQSKEDTKGNTSGRINHFQGRTEIQPGHKDNTSSSMAKEDGKTDGIKAIRERLKYSCIDFAEPEIQYPILPRQEDPIDYIKLWKPHYRKTICVDFDGVIHNHVYAEDFSTWFNLYSPMLYAKEAMECLIEAGWWVVVHTLREITGPLINWFKIYDIPLHDLNGIRGHKTRFWEHNPEYSSHKPLADVYLDDKDLFWIYQSKKMNCSWDWRIVITLLFKYYSEMNWKNCNQENLNMLLLSNLLEAPEKLNQGPPPEPNLAK